jgi:aldehyde:ferredoxin oxidoreductase
MLYGFTGNILHVNLTTGEIEIEHPTEEFYRTYWGGSAMGMYYLLKNTPAHADPLGPENTLCLMLSAPTGAAISGQSRATATAKSPLSGLVGDSQAGGFWPAELKFAGFDGIVITGQSPKPVYFWIHDGQVELRDASHLWGKITGEAERAIRQELGDEKIEVAQIGPAGEKLVRFACIMNMSNRAHGRTGLGAVMGSKNLKAIAVRGHGKINVADKAALVALAKRGAADIPNLPDMQSLQDYGTPGVVASQNATGTLPTRNYTSGTFEHSDQITGELMADKILKQNDTCYACAVRCKRVVETEYLNRKVEPLYGGAEYETIATFGSYCGVDDLNAISLAHHLAAQYGVDTVTCGATIAFAIECFEKGLLTTADTDGIELKFGNAEAMIAMVGKIAARQGLGDLLAEGSARAANRIGQGAQDFVIAVKGHELPAHMPQVKRSLGLIYAVNPFGADHQSSEHDPGYAPTKTGEMNVYLKKLAELGLTQPQRSKVMNEEKVKFALITQHSYSFSDTADLCQFVWGPAWTLYGPNDRVELMRAVTGWDVTLEETLQVGERRVNRCGVHAREERASRTRRNACSTSP